MPQRLGPILLGPPLLRSWHCWQRSATFWPWAESAFGSTVPQSGNPSETEAVLPADAACEGTPATTKPGFAGSGTSKIASVAIFSTRTNINVARTAPAILFHSQESIRSGSACLGLRRISDKGRAECPHKPPETGRHYLSRLMRHCGEASHKWWMYRRK